MFTVVVVYILAGVIPGVVVLIVKLIIGWFCYKHYKQVKKNKTYVS